MFTRYLFTDYRLGVGYPQRYPVVLLSRPGKQDIQSPGREIESVGGLG